MMGGGITQFCPECPQERWGTMCHKCPDRPPKGTVFIAEEYDPNPDVADTGDVPIVEES